MTRGRVLLCAAIIAVPSLVFYLSRGGSAPRKGLTKAGVAAVIADPARFFQLPQRVDLPRDLAPAGLRSTSSDSKSFPVDVHYAFDPTLQRTMEGLFQSYHPDYGAFVALDASTGRVLSMVSFTDHGELKGNLALRATFPSASVFKVVTAAAAIEGNHVSADTVIPFNGRNHTLYRSNVMNVKQTRWTRYMTLKEAFARSVNTVFGRIGAFTVGPQELRQYASRFGFNHQISADVPMQAGHATIPDDPWGLAEAASGFTRENTMSPMQGALIAAAIANDGVMMEPYIVDNVATAQGETIYQAEPEVASTAVDGPTATEIRKLMNVTVKSGTAHGSFRGFFKGELANLQVGGKTGSLTGDDPRGRYDWFVGFADSGTRKVAVAALTVHTKFWRVKSSWLARKAFEEIYRDPLAAMARHGRHGNRGDRVPATPLVLSPEYLAAGADHR
jgi:cell division protein FtsI/penicillin-binding protein 2